jgi:hypothetical protein
LTLLRWRLAETAAVLAKTQAIKTVEMIDQSLAPLIQVASGQPGRSLIGFRPAMRARFHLPDQGQRFSQAGCGTPAVQGRFVLAGFGPGRWSRDR